MLAHPAETCLLANKFNLYSETFRSVHGNVQEITVLTSFGHWVKKPEGEDGAAF